jgi:hypothetical protein
MKTLEEEAKQSTQVLIEYEYFIRGARSKWVQAQIIKAKIDGLLLANDNGSGIMYRIQELEEQLNELEE